MPIKRSQSAPQPIEAIFTSTKIRASTSKAPNADLPRSKSYLVDHSVSHSPLATPWVEREDPFSLGGFFPASNRSAAAEGEQWKWLHRDEDESGRDEGQSVASFSVDEDDSVLGELEDELAGEAIKVEDKLGVLSLDTMFLGSDYDADDRLFSPYSAGEAVDHDSLYLALCARRRANSGVQGSKTDELSKMGGLFFPPTTEEEDEIEDEGSYWPSSVMQSIRRVF